ETKLAANLSDIQTALKSPNFNPGSPKQLARMCKILGVKNVKSTDSKDMQKYMAKNPLMSWVVPKILDYKKARKLLSTYIDSNLYGNRLLYSLNPFGTETARTASKASHLYTFHANRSGDAAFESYGTQVQNLPAYAKQMMRADEGWLLFEIDKSASESWCTAALSRDENLWHTLNTKEDFHCANASMFFGIPYEELYDIATGTKLNVPLRDIAKRVNHGANYNMGAAILVETMGEANIFEARRLILQSMEARNLQATYAYKSLLLCKQAGQVAAYLLGLFDKAYPAIRGRWQQEVIREVLTTNKLVSPSGWTRYCFGNPASNKLDLNAYMAHSPQHLSVKLVNKSLIEIWRTLALPLGSHLRLKAQIHDSIFGQYRIGHEHIVHEAEKLMRVKVTVRGKELSIPNDIELGKEFWK
ncbi:MAG: DNA polymerase, partial [Anaerovoracaceae bacterium]